MTRIAAHFDGERVVLDKPVALAAGTELKIMIVEEEEERKVRVKEGLRRLGEWGRGGVLLEDKYLDDRETYYDDDHRAGLV